MLQSSMEELGIVEKAAVEEEVVKKPLTTYDELDSDDLYVRYLHLHLHLQLQLQLHPAP